MNRKAAPSAIAEFVGLMLYMVESLQLQNRMAVLILAFMIRPMVNEMGISQSMKFEIATYSRSALIKCVDLIRKTDWSVKKKAEHFSKCFEVKKVFDFCFDKAGCLLFEAEYSPWKDYLNAVSRKTESKKEIDLYLHLCYIFLCRELNGISAMMSSGEVNEVD